MPLFCIRVSCKYSVEVEAQNVDEALRKAEQIDLDDWDQAWSEIETEQINPEEAVQG